MNTKAETRHFELEGYNVSLIPSKDYLSAISLDVGEVFRALFRLRVEENLASLGTIDLEIRSQDKAAVTQCSLYNNRLKRLLNQSVLLERYEKSKFLFTIDILHKDTDQDPYHHLINGLTMCVLAAGVEAKYALISSSCFVDGNGKLVDEVQAKHLGKAAGSLKQVFLCKRLDNDSDILSFKMNGSVGREPELSAIFSFLIASSNKIGREIVRFLIQKE